jgi:C1A family cysteine protease
LTTILGLGCAGQTGSGGTPSGLDNDVPLSSYNSIFSGAPPNSTLPDDNKADAVYPRQSTELLSTQSPVRNQARRGDCTVFSSMGLIEHLYIKAGTADPDFSEQYLNWSVKVQYGAYPNVEGSNNADNIKAVSQYGVVEEALWPYNPDPWTAANDPACANNGSEDQQLPTRCWTQGDPPAEAVAAPKFKIPAGRFLNTSSIKAHITSNHTAVVVGIDFFYQAWNHRLSTLPINMDNWAQGIVLYPNDKDVSESHKQRAGHGILIVGWDDDLEFPQRDENGNVVKDSRGNTVTEKGFYLFKNSWGTTRFGVTNPNGAGYGFIAQRYIRDYGSAYVSSVPTVDPPPPPPGMGQKTYRSTDAMAIPDNDPTGVASTISVSDTGTVRAVTIDVDITHTYRGDLEVALVHDGKTVRVFNHEGGSAHDLRQSFNVAGFEGGSLAGDWTLQVVDNAAADTGTLNSWTLHVTAE